MHKSFAYASIKGEIFPTLLTKVVTGNRLLKRIIHKAKFSAYLSLVLRSWKVGLLDGSYDQHSNMTWYRAGGQLWGRGSRSPFSILPITSLFLTPWKGLMPYMRISHIHTPEMRINCCHGHGLLKNTFSLLI